MTIAYMELYGARRFFQHQSFGQLYHLISEWLAQCNFYTKMSWWHWCVKSKHYNPKA